MLRVYVYAYNHSHNYVYSYVQPVSPGARTESYGHDYAKAVTHTIANPDSHTETHVNADGHTGSARQVF